MSFNLENIKELVLQLRIKLSLKLKKILNEMKEVGT
jgi:hypothetical protein